MDNIIDLIATDKPASEISDAIKDALYAKSSDKIDAIKPKVATSMFDEPTAEVEDGAEIETEVDAELDQSDEDQEQEQES
tara:strand:+ start:223 stop:462 length:240 start_codon:yes stop_codon:yes gene_type:complete